MKPKNTNGTWARNSQYDARILRIVKEFPTIGATRLRKLLVDGDGNPPNIGIATLNRRLAVIKSGHFY